MNCCSDEKTTQATFYQIWAKVQDIFVAIGMSTADSTEPSLKGTVGSIVIDEITISSH